MTHEISIFVKILFNFKKKILAWIKANVLKTPLILPKTKNSKLITSRHFKNLISPKPACNSQWSLIYSKNLKRKRHCPAFQIIPDFFFTRISDFFTKSSKLGHGNLVLITSSVQVDPWKLNFNFDDIRTNFLQVLSYYGFSR